MKEIEESKSSEFRMSDVSVDIDSNFSFRKCLQFIGPGFLISVGYLDPGNWATDIEGGSRFGYQLLWVLLMSNVIALLLQTLSARLGLLTERDLARQCRFEYPKIVCYILWVLCELAIAATDLAEVLGTAIGLELLFGLPLLFGVIFTVGDTLIFLLVQRYGARKLELLVFLLLSIITLCFIVELFLSKPDFLEILSNGFIPIVSSESIYTAMAILGATVMPHNFYLHSSLVQTRKFARSSAQIQQACLYNLVDSAFALNIAFFVNASILIVSAATFFKRGVVVTQLEDAYSLLDGFLQSSLAPFVFGLGLFCAGQSSTLTGTLAGQIVMEGFLDMRMRPWLRRLITRSVAIVPAIIVISIMGNSGTYKLLIFSQIILSLQLPFAIVPLIRFTSNRNYMREFANTRFIKCSAWFCAAIIILLNIWMVVENLVFLLNYSFPVKMLTILLLFPSFGGLVLLLLYLAFKGTFLPIELKKILFKMLSKRSYVTLTSLNEDVELSEH